MAHTLTLVKGRPEIFFKTRYTHRIVRRFCPYTFPLLAFLPLLLAAAAPAPPPEVVWQTRYEAAHREALATKKPLFVLFRCPRVTDWRALDSPAVTRENPELAEELARNVVPVRLDSLKGVDLDTFRFDYDLNAAALILDPASGKTLARWGTRDSASAVSRLSLPGLVQLLRAVGKEYQPSGTAKVVPQRLARTLTDRYPQFARSKRAQEPCYHCHYANDARFAQALGNNTFRKAMLFQFPLPENIGVTLDIDRGNIVQKVLHSSPAAKAGLRIGDTIIQANDTHVYSVADLQWALDPLPDTGNVTLRLQRNGKIIAPATLSLFPGWRETDISWRPSQGGIPPILSAWETLLTPEEKAPLGIAANRLALRVTYLFSGEKWKAAQGDLEIGDIIVAVGGKTTLPVMTPQQFHAYIRLHYEVGDTLRLTVLRKGVRTDATVPCVAVSLE